MSKVKISGLANLKDALDATNLGADFLAFSFIKDSPAKVSEKMVKDILAKLPPFVTPVGIFEDEPNPTIEKILNKTGLKAVQFNGQVGQMKCAELKEKGIKVFKFFPHPPPDISSQTDENLAQTPHPDNTADNPDDNFSQKNSADIVEKAEIAKIADYISYVDYFIIEFSQRVEDKEGFAKNIEKLKKIQELGVNFFIAGIETEKIKEILKNVSVFGFDFDVQIERKPKRKDYEKMSAAIKLSHGLK